MWRILKQYVPNNQSFPLLVECLKLFVPNQDQQVPWLFKGKLIQSNLPIKNFSREISKVHPIILIQDIKFMKNLTLHHNHFWNSNSNKWLLNQTKSEIKIRQAFSNTACMHVQHFSIQINLPQRYLFSR